MAVELRELPGVYLAAWSGEVTAEEVEASVAGLEAHAARGPLLGYVLVALDGSRNPTVAGRQAFLGHVDRVMALAPHLHVVLETGAAVKALALGLVYGASLTTRFRDRVTIHPTRLACLDALRAAGLPDASATELARLFRLEAAPAAPPR